MSELSSWPKTEKKQRVLAPIEDPVLKKSLEIASQTVQPPAPIKFPEVDPVKILTQKDGRAGGYTRPTPRSSKPSSAPVAVKQSAAPNPQAAPLSLEFMKERQKLIERLLDPLLTEEEAAMLLCVSRKVVQRLQQRGALSPARQAEGGALFRLSTVLQYLQEKKEAAS